MRTTTVTTYDGQVVTLRLLRASEYLALEEERQQLASAEATAARDIAIERHAIKRLAARIVQATAGEQTYESPNPEQVAELFSFSDLELLWGVCEQEDGRAATFRDRALATEGGACPRDADKHPAQ